MNVEDKRKRKGLLKCRAPVNLPLGYRICLWLNAQASVVEVFTRTYERKLRENMDVTRLRGPSDVG
jgi:hypothetical protein